MGTVVGLVRSVNHAFLMRKTEMVINFFIANFLLLPFI